MIKSAISKESHFFCERNHVLERVNVV